MSSETTTQRQQLLTELTFAGRELSEMQVMFLQAMADQLGLNTTDLKCGDILSRIGPLTAGQLAEITGLTSGAITAVIDRLERAGFVRRERDAVDRRRVIVQPLPERADEVEALFAPMAKAWTALADRYTDDELAMILEFMHESSRVLHDQIRQLTERGQPTMTPRQ